MPPANIAESPPEHFEERKLSPFSDDGVANEQREQMCRNHRDQTEHDHGRILLGFCGDAAALQQIIWEHQKKRCEQDRENAQHPNANSNR